MKNLTANQWLTIAIGILGVFTAASAQLTDLFGPMLAKDIASLAALLMSCLSVILSVSTGQNSQVTFVKNMPGVEKILVNPQANPALAQMAMDPTQTKVQPVSGAEADLKVRATQ